MESRQDSLWLQGTRRYTRSVSNQEKEAKEKVSLKIGSVYNIICPVMDTWVCLWAIGLWASLWCTQYPWMI